MYGLSQGKEWSTYDSLTDRIHSPRKKHVVTQVFKDNKQRPDARQAQNINACCLSVVSICGGSYGTKLPAKREQPRETEYVSSLTVIANVVCNSAHIFSILWIMSRETHVSSESATVLVLDQLCFKELVSFIRVINRRRIVSLASCCSSQVFCFPSVGLYTFRQTV